MAWAEIEPPRFSERRDQEPTIEMSERGPPPADAGAAKAPGGAITARIGRDLGPRLASAAVLGSAALALTWWGGWPFAALVLVVGTLLCWEWGRVVRGAELDWSLSVHAGVVAASVILTALGFMAPALLAILVGAIVVGALAYGRSALMSAAGVLYVGLPAVALIWLRADPTAGLAGLLLVMAVVWTTDTGAYLAGRGLGGPRLWPAVSPNKTWSGLIGGVSAGGLVASLFVLALPGTSWLRLLALGLTLALVSQAGDLGESALKRVYGVKDASGLIPGHGGFMDRVDGLLAAVVAAAILAVAVGVQRPAAALLGLP